MDGTDRLLCAIDDDGQGPQLVCAARTLAASMNCAARFVHVVMPGTSAARVAERPGRSARMLMLPPTTNSSAADEFVSEAVDEAEMLMLRLGIDPHECQILLGGTVLELRAVAASVRPPVLMVGTRAEGSMNAALRGSVSRELLRDAPCPVMVVPRMADPTLAGETIVCGADDDGGAEDATIVACRLAEAMGKRLVLAHVARAVCPVASGRTYSQTSLAADRSPDLVTERAARLLGHVRSLVSDRLDVRMMLRRGRAVDELIEIAREVNAGALVVASRDRGLVRAALRGSVAQELMTRSFCPVVAVPRRLTAHADLE
jgi:nucleotide-binding universal stress UspA family protein